MNNYHYIVAGLPDIMLDYSAQQFSYQSLSEQIRGQLSAKDSRLVDWIEFGLTPDNLGNHFYREAAKSSNQFIRGYFEFDHLIRNAQVRYLSKQTGKSEKAYLVGEADNSFEEYSKLQQILEMPGIIEREHAIDALRWEKVSELTTFHYFDMDVILAFLIKAKMVDRWLRMDKIEGARLFEQLVSEVRGTFTGIKF